MERAFRGGTAQRGRTRRQKLPTEIPLDDGARDGTEIWRDLEGVSFCHWDRWLLRLAIEEPDGLTSITREFRRRVRVACRTEHAAEAMLAQVGDLETRLRNVGRTPRTILDDAERASTWLRDKAFRRVWHATSIRRLTLAMSRTPRNVLAERAREGNFAVFPVSPAPYLARLRRLFGGCYFDYRGVELVVMQLDFERSRMLRETKHDDERLAVHRAVVGASIEAMEHVDDSGDELGGFFRDEEPTYLTLVTQCLETRGILRDLLELAVWEDYGLFRDIEFFLSRLPEHGADQAVRELAQIIAELRGAELKYQCDKARQLRRSVLRAVDIIGEGDA